MSTENKELSIQEQIDVAVAAAVEEKAKSLIDGAAGVAGASSVHLDKPLSDFSVKVVQDDSHFKAASIVSNFNSKFRQDMYYFYEPAYFMINQVAARAEGAEAARAKYGVSRKSYSTIVYGLKQPVTDETVANADKAIERIYEDAAAFITRQFLLNKEKLFATAFLGAGNWSTDWEGTSAPLQTASTDNFELVVQLGRFLAFDDSRSIPLDVLDHAMEVVQLRSGLRPNTMVMTRSVFSALKRNTSIKTLKLYTNANSTTDEAVLDTIAGHLGIPLGSIYVLDVVEATGTVTVGNTTAMTIDTDSEGYAQLDATGLAPGGFVGGTGILLMYIDKNSNGQYSATACVCAQWTGLYPDGGDLGNTVFKRYREEDISSEMIEGRTAFSYHIVAPALGLFLDRCISADADVIDV